MYVSMIFLPTQAPSLRLYTPNPKNKKKKKITSKQDRKTRQKNLEHWLIVHFVKMHPYFHLSYGIVVQKGYDYTTERASTGLTPMHICVCHKPRPCFPMSFVVVF